MTEQSRASLDPDETWTEVYPQAEGTDTYCYLHNGAHGEQHRLPRNPVKGADGNYTFVCGLPALVTREGEDGHPERLYLHHNESVGGFCPGCF